MGGSGFFKGEKKKPKKNENKNNAGFSTSTAPVFTLPKMIEKKKRNSF